jgi:hypothetical protein
VVNFLFSNPYGTWRRLAVIGAENIEKLQSDPDFVKVWKHIRNQASDIFRLGGKQIDDIGELFSTFYVKMWTQDPWVLKVEKGCASLVIRLWALLFPPLPLPLCGGLVHEANHFKYLREKDLLNKSRAVLERHRSIMEVRALVEELDFLEKVSEYAPSEIAVVPDTNLILIRDSLPDGCRMHLNNFRKQGHGYSTRYHKITARVVSENQERIAKALKIDMEKMSRDRKILKVQFWT